MGTLHRNGKIYNGDIFPKVDNIKSRESIKHKYNVLVISSYPPKLCGIATYTYDLINALKTKFSKSLSFQICPIESDAEINFYDENIKYHLNTSSKESYENLANEINDNETIDCVFLQHEFGLFSEIDEALEDFIAKIEKEIVLTFHTVLPKPISVLKDKIMRLSAMVNIIIVMTNSSANILKNDYSVNKDKIVVIPHGTHLISMIDKKLLKKQLKLDYKFVISTFGLLGEGKNIESTIQALPEIIKKHPNVIFLIIGKTHPNILKEVGEDYRKTLKSLIIKNNLQKNVKFIDEFLPTDKLLEYLQLTDIYLFTSKDRNQAVSGTFSYALGSGCPIISTPIPHAIEMLTSENGILIDFESPKQLSKAVTSLLNNKPKRDLIRYNAINVTAPTSWENSAIRHAELFSRLENSNIKLIYDIPPINLNHLINLTTNFGIVQFSKLNTPDLLTGYTLDDNARALIAMVNYYKIYKEKRNLDLISIYLNFINFCQQKDGRFLNYVNKNQRFSDQNYKENLEDANGRAIWAIGTIIKNKELLPRKFYHLAEEIMKKALPIIHTFYSTRAMAFAIKGLCYQDSPESISEIRLLSNRLVEMYNNERDEDWHWFESYLTYANAVLPEELLLAYRRTNISQYKQVSDKTFKFLLSKIIINDQINVISNRGWLHKNTPHIGVIKGGQQPIDVAYTILALFEFYKDSLKGDFRHLMTKAFSWFLGNNHLKQIVYNPKTGGCYDGVEINNVNLNQGAESTVSYLMARLCFSEMDLL